MLAPGTQHSAWIIFIHDTISTINLAAICHQTKLSQHYYFSNVVKLFPLTHFFLNLEVCISKSPPPISLTLPYPSPLAITHLLSLSKHLLLFCTFFFFLKIPHISEIIK